MNQSKQPSPHLYLVATPIGHLKDMTHRAIQVLQQVDTIYCEDTRITSRLLQAYDIRTPLKVYHEHNAEAVRPLMIEAMQQGKTLALVSDAGTPLISDPGYKLVQEVYNHDLIVSVIPGACAAIAALAVSGLPTDRFYFGGFLPSKKGARQAHLQEAKEETGTIIYYESPQRLLESLQDIQEILGNRQVSVIRELTKMFEEVKRGSCEEVLQWYQAHPPRGEIVICIAGAQADVCFSEAWKTVIHGLLDHMKTKELSHLIAEISPYSKSQIYDYVLQHKKDKLL